MAVSKLWKAHLCMLLAAATWGLMAPIGKDAMTHGISGMDMVMFRTCGGAICFWIASLCVRTKEAVAPKDLALLFLAAMLSIVANQCCFTIGLSITSPINASIVTTSMPIFTLILGLVFATERLSWRKALGMLLGVSGALALILCSTQGISEMSGNIRGDILCMTAQLCFAIYLALFGKLIARYSIITCMKWMFTFASLVTLPLGFQGLLELPWTQIQPIHWLESAFVVVGATFFAYLLMMRGQKILTPSQVSVYNYVQPVVSTTVSLLMGVATLGWLQGIAVVCIFLGVRLVGRKK